MAENLGGISEDVSALIRAINAALPQSNTKKTVDIKVNGAKELKEAAESVKTFGAAVKTLDESGVDRVTKSVGSIMGLLSGKLKNAPVSSITTSLIEVFTKPDASAKQLLDTVLQVQSQLENVQRLSKKIDVSLLTSSQLDSLLSRQSKIDELQYEFSSNKGSEGRKDPRKYELRREVYKKYEDIDVYQMARKAKRGGHQTAQEIAANIGIDPNTVTSADGEQLQTYIRTLDLLKQLISAKKEYGEIHTSADANNYLKQEQQISKVFQDVLKQEAAIREKFKVKGDPLSAAFGLDEQTVKQNAQQAAEAYVNWFMRTLQTQLNAALSDLDTRVAQLQGNIEKRTEQSAQRVEKNTKFARGRGNGKAGGGSGSGTGGTGEGVGDGTGGTGSGGGEIGAGVQQAGQAVHKLSEELRKYIVSEDEAIDKIHDLLDDVIKLEEEMGKDDIDSDEYDKKFTEQEEKYKEMLRYRANLIRQGYDSDKYDEEFGIGAWADLDKNTKDIIGGKLRREINDISTYVDSNPITVKVDTKEADEKTQAVKDKVIDLSKDIGERTKIRIFDGVSEEVFDVEKDLDALIAKLDQMALKMEKPVFHAGDLEKDSLSSDSYRPADSLQFVVERHRGDSMGTGTYFASNLGDIIEALHTKSSEGKSGGIYAADLGKYGSSLLQFSGDEEQEAFGEFLRKVTAFVMSIASEDEAFKKQLGSIKVGDTQALFNELKTWFDMFHVNIEDLQAFIDEQVAYVKGFASTSEMSQSKSIGTNFQQKFIKNKGIDITRGVLNDSYALGNLIFDLDKERPFDIAFGNNEDIAAYFYKKVFERILSRKAANPLNYVDDIVDQYIGNSGMPSIEEMGTELTPKLQVIGKAHANDKPESISTLNASLLQRDSTVGIDTSEAQKQIEALKQQVSELQSQLQELSTVDKPVVDVDELQARLERAQEEIDELNHALAGTVSESSNNFLSEQLSEAEQRIHELSEEVASLKQQLTDTQQKVQQAPLDMGTLDKKVAELQYLHDKVRTIFDGKDGIINEDMSYSDKFNSSEVQRMIELLSQLSDAELKAAGVMPDDEGSYDSFRQQLQERIALIKEAQDEIQKVIDGQSNEDRNELDLNIARQLEEIYGMAEEVGAKFESRLTPAVREFLSLIEGHVGADEMSNFLGQQNIDRYVDDIISGTKTAKEAFADLENSFGWDTDRFASLIDGEVPEELKGLYDQLFSDVENRIKSAEQAADEFNAKLKEISEQSRSDQSPISSGTTPEQERAAGDAAAAAAESMKNQAAAVREAEENYNRLNNAVQQYIENQNKVNVGNYRIVHTDNPKDRGRISDMVNYTDIRKGRTTKTSIKKILDEYITNKKELDTGYLHGLTDEESFKLSDDDLRFRASNADRILDKLSAYVYSYQNMEEAAKLFGNANSDVFDEVQRRIENAKIANEAFEASFTKSDNVRYALSKYGIDEMTARQLSQLESAMETGGFEAFAAKVKELFGVEIPSSIEEAREAINNLNAESQSLDPSQDGETSSQKREQENETEVQSVEQLIAEYERLGSVLNSIESKYNAGQIPLGEARDTWNEVNENRKAIAEKLTQSGMYYSPDQEKWVQDIINLEDKYKELSALIESGDKKAISEMFKIDESSLGDLEILKNNLKMVIDVLNAADGMSASGAKLSWWDGWLGGGRDLFNTDELTGALKTLGISDDIIEQVAQAHRDAAEAAKQHAAEEQAAADATKNVVDAAGAQKVPGKEQPSINPENTGETSDMSALGDAVNAVTKAVDDKTMAFAREAQTVQESVQMEIASLQQLVQQLEAIRDLSQNLPKIQLTGKDGTKANPIISPELIKSIEQLKTAVGDFDPAKLTALFSSIKNLRINENVSTRMTELATGFTDLRNALDGWEGNAAKTLEMITQLVQKANALKDVIKTANEQNVKQPKVEKTSGEKKEPEKPEQKSQDEIRADQLKAYNAALKEFQALENARVRTGQSVDKLGAETLSKRVQLTSQLDSIQKAWNDDAAKGVAKTKEMLAAEQQRLVNAEEIKAAESNKWNEQVKRSINFSNLQSRTTKLKAEKDLRPDAFGPRYEEIEKKAKELSLLFPLKPFDEDAAQNARDMAEQLDKMITETRNAPEYKLAKDNYVSGLERKMETWAANNGRAVAANKGAWENIQKELKQIDTLADGQNVSKMFDKFVAGANRAGQAGETFTQGLMKRFKSLGQYLLSFASFYRVIGVFKQVYGTVKELDDALVEMRKVSDESLSSLQRYQSLSFNMADEVGTTAQQIQQSTADWLRLGESFEEAQKSAKESTILLNVSEFDNIDKATEALVSASQAYKDLDKIDIIDKLNNIGNNFSISTDQLATGLQNAAAVLMTQGNDIDEALALLTAGNALPGNTVMYLLECI